MSGSFAADVGVRVVGVGKRTSRIVDDTSRGFGQDKNVLQSILDVFHPTIIHICIMN